MLKNLYIKFKRWSTWATVEEACELKKLSLFRRIARWLLP